MNIIDGFILEFQHETATTRKLLERIPQEHFDWAPHTKSMTFGALGSHIVDAINWVGPTLEQDEMVMDPSTYKPWVGANVGEVLETFDKNVGAATETMSKATDEKLLQTWTMKVGDQVVFSMPRIAVLRTFIISHQIHHRGQLDVYLRLKDIPLPQVYGPSADEQDMFPSA